MYRLVDTHAHLEEIDGLEGVLGKAREAGVCAVIAVGSDAASNEKVLQLARSYAGFVYPALGLHPWNLKQSDLALNLDSIERNVGGAVAVGEVGLDYHKKVREIADKDMQKEALREVLRIATKHNKPVIVHSRYAWRDAFDVVREALVEKAVFHWYTGTSSVLRDIIAQGYYISANPAVEYHEEHRRAVKEAPLERLLLETDAPVTYGRDELRFESRPADVVRVLRGVASLKALSEGELAEATTRNAEAFFGLKLAQY